MKARIRFDALRELEAKSFPALMVLDLDSLGAVLALQWLRVAKA